MVPQCIRVMTSFLSTEHVQAWVIVRRGLLLSVFLCKDLCLLPYCALWIADLLPVDAAGVI